jgi:fucose permease
MMAFGSGTAIAMFAFLSAACMAPSLPIMFAKACGTSCDDTAAASALIFFGVAVSALIAPPLIGVIGDLSNLRIALLANAGIYIFVIGLSVLLYKLFDKPLKKAE